MTITRQTTIPTKPEVLATLSAILREIVDEDWISDVAITMDTSFDELELESIEFVSMAEKIQERYGRTVDFPGWLSGMALEQIIALRVGRVVEFIVECLSRPETA